MKRTVLTHKQAFELANFVKANYEAQGLADDKFAAGACLSLGFLVNANNVATAREVVGLKATRDVLREKNSQTLETALERLAVLESTVEDLERKNADTATKRERGGEMTCLITGCDLVDLVNDKWVHGDLHKIGHNYVFNACLHTANHPGQGEVQGEAAWQHGTMPDPSSKQIVLDIKIMPSGRIFERRGVITFPAVFGELNDVAKAYLGKLPV